MEMNNTTQAFEATPRQKELSPEATVGATVPAKRTRKRLLLLIGLLGLGILISLPICQFFVGFAASFPEEIASTEKVIDAYLTAMANKDVARAYEQVLTSGETPNAYSDLASLTQGNNYILFQGYQQISFADFELTQVGPIKSAEISGYVMYEGSFVGQFSAVLVKENGAWKIQAIQVNAPPDKFGKAN